MTESRSDDLLKTGGLFLAACVFSVLAYASWDQALDFDPCNNFFKPPSQKCVTSALEPVIIGLFVIGIAGGVLQGLVRRGAQVLGSATRVMLSAWMCVCAMLVGAALIFGVLTTDLPPPEPDAAAVAST
jgi:hypothetical protein